jgi:hypothetical protein
MTDFKPTYNLLLYAIASLLMKLKNANGPRKLPLLSLAPAKIPATQPVTTLWPKILVSFPFSSKGKLPRIHISSVAVSYPGLYQPY